MWETRSELWKQTYFTQNLLYFVFTVFFIFVEMMVDQTFRYDVIYLSSFVQGSHWVLENHLAFTDNFFIQLFRDLAVDFLTFKVDFTSGGWVNSKNCTTDSCFTRTGLTYQREGLTFVDVEIYMVYCNEFLFTGTETDLQIFQFD